MTPRPRNNKKAVLAALHASVETHQIARAEGRKPDACKDAAYQTFRRLTADNGSYGMIETMPILAALNAANEARDEAEAAKLPPEEARKRANEAFDAVLASGKAANLPTGPPH